MTETRGDYLTRFKASGKPLSDAPVCVLLPPQIDAYVRSLPDRSAWLRQVITAAVEKEKGNKA